MDRQRKLEAAAQKLNHILANLDLYTIDDYCEAAKEYTIAEQQAAVENNLRSHKPCDVIMREAAAATFKER